ncbi:MAG: hypothetical protein HBSAPP01_13020 [Candidatus Brocadia sapporoensis]|nr:MAG: hypothetical protein HBSAPP01_13020 [Candidatus Brocadia sapporoensis]
MRRMAAVFILLISLPPLYPTHAENKLLSKPILFMYGYADKVTGSPTRWSDKALYKEYWDKVINNFNVIDGTTKDAEFVTILRKQGKVFAYHVLNTIDEKHQTVDDFVKSWSEPFENTLGGKLIGGFDAICIDEFHSYADDSKESRIAIEALRRVREKYPDRLIFVSGVWKLGDGGPISLHGNKKTIYDEQLNAVNKYADIFVLENYQRTGNPQLYLFESMAKNIESRSPGLLKKTIFGLYISQSKPYIADDNPEINYFDFLEKQMHLIKTNRYTNHMPGIGFWIFYRTKPETIEKLIGLTDKYYHGK